MEKRRISIPPNAEKLDAFIEKQKRKEVMERKQEENTTVFTKKELWLNQASYFNFELDEDELLEKALNCEFVTRVGENQFLVNK